MNFTLADLATTLRSIGRGVVFQSLKWTGAADIALTHLGDTEGNITVGLNESYVHLTTPELTGQGKHKSYVEGMDPVVTIPLFVADPTLRAILSPTGTASGGHERRRPVTERTMAIFPEELFYNPTAMTYQVLAYTTAGGWTLNGVALTAAQTALLGQSVWFWRGYFTAAGITFAHADGGKALEQVSFQAMYDSTKPDGHRFYTIGNPVTAGINIDLP